MRCDYEGCGQPAESPAGEFTMALCDEHLVEFAGAIDAGPVEMLRFWVRAHGGSGSLTEQMLGRASGEVADAE